MSTPVPAVGGVAAPSPPGVAGGGAGEALCSGCETAAGLPWSPPLDLSAGTSRKAPSAARARTTPAKTAFRCPGVSSIARARYFRRRIGRNQNGPRAAGSCDWFSLLPASGPGALRGEDAVWPPGAAARGGGAAGCRGAVCRGCRGAGAGGGEFRRAGGAPLGAGGADRGAADGACLDTGWGGTDRPFPLWPASGPAALGRGAGPGAAAPEPGRDGVPDQLDLGWVGVVSEPFVPLRAQPDGGRCGPSSVRDGRSSGGAVRPAFAPDPVRDRPRSATLAPVPAPAADGEPSGPVSAAPGSPAAPSPLAPAPAAAPAAPAAPAAAPAAPAVATCAVRLAACAGLRRAQRATR